MIRNPAALLVATGIGIVIAATVAVLVVVRVLGKASLPVVSEHRLRQPVRIRRPNMSVAPSSRLPANCRNRHVPLRRSRRRSPAPNRAGNRN
jgi:hypothetical protein